ncbi:MAG: SBBP repeat-containing protein, partial [Bacteroidota bacterium]|nr:SBBP repeat-containing protein [Bacteroidota bacterium]
MIQIKYLIIILLTLFVTAAQAQDFSQQPDNNAAVTNLLSQPLLFEKNNGQVEGNVEYFAKTPRGVTYFFTKEGVTIALTKHSREKEKTLAHSLKVNFVGANTEPTITAEDQAPSVTNYFRGKDPKKWLRHVPNFEKIRYTNIYDGIDLVYYGNGKKIEYDFVVHPGADPNVIRIKYEGAEEALKLLENGSVEIATSVGMMNEMKPVAYQLCRHPELVSGSEQMPKQVRHDERMGVVAQWKLCGSNELQFSIGEYDRSQILYIDPLLYSTYLGSNHEEVAMDIAVDADGNAYIMGYTTSPNFPTTAGAYDTTFNAARMDVFISKINASGNALAWSTFLGGADDISFGFSTLFRAANWPWLWVYGGITLDRSDNILIAGITDGADFPTTPGAYDETYNGGAYDVFLTKLSSLGDSLLFSTYFGGAGGEQLFGHCVAVDTSDNVYITGSGRVPVTPGAFITEPCACTQGFIAKFNTEGSLIYSTFLNGTIDNTYTWCFGIAVDNDGNAYVTGATDQTDFPTTPSAYDTSFNGYADGFVTKMNATGSGIIFSTYVGGSDNDDRAWAITLDHHRNVYITGTTHSANYPTTFGAYDRSYNGSNDAFLTKLDSSGSSLVYSSFLGKDGYDFGVDIAVDGNNNALIFGTTSGYYFPTTPGAYDVTFNGGSGGDNAGDCFLTKFNAAGSLLLYSTFLGGTNDNRPTALALDPIGNAYVTGGTLSSDFPTTSGAFDETFNESADVFVTKLSPFIPGNVTIKKVMDYDGLMST